MYPRFGHILKKKQLTFFIQKSIIYVHTDKFKFQKNIDVTESQRKSTN